MRANNILELSSTRRFAIPLDTKVVFGFRQTGNRLFVTRAHISVKREGILLHAVGTHILEKALVSTVDKRLISSDVTMPLFVIASVEVLELTRVGSSFKTVPDRIKHKVDKMPPILILVLSAFEIAVDMVKRFHAVAFTVRTSKTRRHITAIMVKAVSEKRNSRGAEQSLVYKC